MSYLIPGIWRRQAKLPAWVALGNSTGRTLAHTLKKLMLRVGLETSKISPYLWVV